jgi:HD superfamily phosphohydrolase YqeK
MHFHFNGKSLWKELAIHCCSVVQLANSLMVMMTMDRERSNSTNLCHGNLSPLTKVREHTQKWL